jgi:hypothetical protein
MSQGRGFPGKEGQRGKPGEEGKDTGEGGRGGEGGEGGVGGAGAPQGPGGGGGEGGIGGRGARGAQGPPGERGADGGQPKLRWTPAVGYVLLAVVLGFLIFRIQDLGHDNRRLIVEVAALSQAQAEKGYQECVARNARATESIKAFGKLVAAHKQDGSTQAARVWQSYLDETTRHPLPPCAKPTPIGGRSGTGLRGPAP